MLLQAVKSVVKPISKPAEADMASCSRGRGWIINEKLKEMSTMGPVAVSWYSEDTDAKKKKAVAGSPLSRPRKSKKPRNGSKRGSLTGTRRRSGFLGSSSQIRSHLPVKCWPLRTGYHEYHELSTIPFQKSPGTVSPMTNSGRNRTYRCPDLVPSNVDILLICASVLGG